VNLRIRIFATPCSSGSLTRYSIEERCGALIGLAQQAGQPEIRTYAEEFYQNGDCRAKAMEAMWRSLDRAFAEYFRNIWMTQNQEIRRQRFGRWLSRHLRERRKADEVLRRRGVSCGCALRVCAFSEARDLEGPDSRSVAKD